MTEQIDYPDIEFEKDILSSECYDEAPEDVYKSWMGLRSKGIHASIGRNKKYGWFVLETGKIPVFHS